MDRKNADASFYQYMWVIMKSLFLVCLLIFVISIFVMYFSMPDRIALFLTLFSMFIGIAFCGYEAALLSQSKKKIAAFMVSLFVSVVLVIISVVFKMSFNISKYHMYIILFGPILGFVMGAFTSNKARRTKIKRR
ncbi:hypothetical protein Calkr_1507 [Caldicellulosiruptor acetigenus I77R1B]|uniref:TIGR04086 family membrane protein n=1 Tax=Caldicellulosiruptor acetigenus (strain ATCC 700853 / DSM 12137 / I77R1B) TaxID=632335 RepID=E4S9D7_CALA7|nr:hypothetical protein [Caldicellulosiruptor acetigenus]ADQ41006.1 hypothetical protein Calkr_1507 [Caldicellulosiruptor acetigenus I77R1B]